MNSSTLWGRSLICAGIILLGVDFVLADDGPDARAADTTEVSALRLYAGIDWCLFQHTYEEPGLMIEEGFFKGFAVLVGIEGEDGLMEGELGLSTGKIEYDGHLMTEQGLVPYTTNEIKNVIFELRARVGRKIIISPIRTFTPYIGIASRIWDDDLSSDENGYHRESKYVFVPLGVDFQTQMENPDWLWTGRAEFDYFIRGRQVSTFRDYSQGSITNNQKKGYGWRVYAGIMKKSDSGKRRFNIQVFYVNWDISNSDIVEKDGLQFIEPANTTEEMGLALELRF